MDVGSRVINTMKKTSILANPKQDMTDAVFGTVKSLSPLKISIENKFELEESQIITTPFCFDKSIRIQKQPHAHEYSDGATQPGGDIDITVKVWEGLKVGSKVLMLRVHGGQAYIIHSIMG